MSTPVTFLAGVNYSGLGKDGAGFTVLLAISMLGSGSLRGHVPWPGRGHLPDQRVH